MPALEMAQETGKLIRWLKHPGDTVAKGEPLMEVETDKVTVEIEATASGIVSSITAQEGDVIPVGQTIGWIFASDESMPLDRAAAAPTASRSPSVSKDVPASPLARRIAAEHGVDLAAIKSAGRRIEKADVLAYIDQQANAAEVPTARLSPASPKARRLAIERGLDLNHIAGSGPYGAVLIADVDAVVSQTPSVSVMSAPPQSIDAESLSQVWRVMAERMTASWTSVPHFYLMREVSAQGLVDLRARLALAIEKRRHVKPTYTDFLVKLVAVVLRDHPRLNASWVDSEIHLNHAINVGIATAIDEGLIVPVIHRADELSLSEIAVQRHALVTRANEKTLRLSDIADGTFTITNLGMYNVDAFNAIVNPPQAAILTVGRIADRVVPINSAPAIRPMMILSLACDHRVVDGARGAKFLDDLANLIEEPWEVLV